jgi:membrane fusion protein (multidrug efflux system)
VRPSWTFALALLVTLACSEEPPAQAPPPPAVSVVSVSRIAIDETLDFVGQTEAYRHVDLRARVEGVLEKREFREGQDVTEGQLLFSIERERYAAEFERTWAEVARSQASLDRALQELARTQRLFERDAAAQDRLDEVISAANEAAATVTANEAALRQAELNLGYTEIRAPVSGRIGRVNVNVGNVVGPDQGVLAAISQIDPIYVTFSVSERTVLEREQEIREHEARGESVEALVPELRLSDKSRYEHPGEFDFIGETIDATTGSVPVRLLFPNPDGVLRPGQYVNVVIRQEEPVERLVVPQSAMQQNQEGYFVLVVDEANQVEARPVQAGSRYETLWIIESGLELGERVIVEGVQKVRPGAEVAPSELAPPAASAAATGA